MAELLLQIRGKYTGTGPFSLQKISQFVYIYICLIKKKKKNYKLQILKTELDKFDFKDFAHEKNTH